MARSTSAGGGLPEFEELEALPAADGERPSPAAAGSRAEPVEQPLEELPAVEEPGAAGRPARLGVHTIPDLFDLIGDDLPAVAEEGGVYRVQRHAHGRSAGRDPDLRRLADAVTGDSPLRQDGRPLPLLTGGIDLDRFAAGAPAESAEDADPLNRALHRLCGRAKALGAALLVREPSGGYRAQQVTGSLRHSAGRLMIAPDDPAARLYLARRVALIAAGRQRRQPGGPAPAAGSAPAAESALAAGLTGQLSAAARGRTAGFALLPAQAGGGPAYLLLAAADDDAAWDAHGLVARLGLVAADDSGAPAPPPRGRSAP